MNDLFAKDYDLNSMEKIRTKRYGIDRPEFLHALAKQGHDFARKKFTRQNFGGRYYDILKSLKHAENPLNNQVFRFIDDLFISAFADKDQAIQALNARIGEKERTLHEKEQLLQDMYQSRAWNLIERLRCIKLIYFPLGSRREKLWYS